MTRHTWIALALALASCNVTGSDESALGRGHDHDAGSDAGGACVFTQGYWKNHPDAWPVSSLALGARTYSEDELLRVLHTAVKGNGLVQLAHQLITAKLNVANGGITSIAHAITDADALIGSLVVPPIGDGYLKTNQTSTLTDALDAYNSQYDGGGCAGGGGSCDAGGCPPPPVCGNGIVEPGEQCDDGNTVCGDGCSSTCTSEATCGNGVVEPGEQCDDGNTTSGDGCSATCTKEATCGNGIVEPGEQCDDGNTVGGDGCSATCLCECPTGH